MKKLARKKIVLPLAVLFFLFVVPSSVFAIDWDYTNSGDTIPDGTSGLSVYESEYFLNEDFYLSTDSGILQLTIDPVYIDPIQDMVYFDSVEPVTLGSSFSFNFSIRGQWGFWLSTSTNYFYIAPDNTNINLTVRDDSSTYLYTLGEYQHFVDNFHDIVVSYTSPDFSIYIDNVLIGTTTGTALEQSNFFSFYTPSINYPQTMEIDYINISYDEPYDPTYTPPIEEQLTLEQNIKILTDNSNDIKAFFYVLSVLLLVLSVLFLINKIFNIIYSRIF